MSTRRSARSSAVVVPDGRWTELDPLLPIRRGRPVAVGGALPSGHADAILHVVDNGIMCRSKSHRCWSGGLSVFVDESAEDAGAKQSVGVEGVDWRRLLLGLGW